MKLKTGLICVLIVGGLFADACQTLGQGRGRGRGQRPGSEGARRSESPSDSDGIKPYDEVITKEAKSRPGLFLTHQVDDKLYYEIPVARLGKDMLWVIQVEQTQAGFSYAGMPIGDRVVRWELRGEKLLLRDVKYAIRASGKGAINKAVEETSVASIVKVFDVKAWGKDKAPVVDVTSLFTSDVTEFSARRSLNASGMDSSRTFLDLVKAFPTNLEVKVLATYNLAQSTPPTTGRGRRGGARRDPTQSSVTALIHHSMLALPEQPMKARVHDPRVGFFTVGFEDYADISNHQVENVRFVTRWRLEKKDPEADVSEPVKPIVFYVAREVPEKWKPYIKKGIEAWQPAFEKAGFKNAIIAKDAPSPNENPDWDAEDARISTVRWLASTTENAFGPHVHDPRTGEILEADVRMYHNVMKLARDWYFVQASPNDKRAQQLPLPDDLVGELISYIVAHEVGHSIGFPHNMKASAAYTVANLRDPEFTKKHGVEASIMDYGRFNYVAQPGDGAALIPVVGPYDYFAIDWGYRPYKDEKAEKEGLAALYKKQIKDQMLRFGNANPSEDPTRQTEDLGSDPVAATAMGMKNIDRVAKYLVKASCKEGEDYSLLQNMYDQLISQRTRELVHVTSVVGGFEQVNLYYGDAELIYRPIDTQRQRKAVQFLNEHAFKTPTQLLTPDITRRLEAAGTADRVLGSQRSVLRALLSDTRLNRMIELCEADESAYDCLALLRDLRQGIFGELEQEKVEIDLYRRNLQRAYVDTLVQKTKAEAVASDVPAIARAELVSLRRGIKQKLTNGSPMTLKHLAHISATIDQALNPRTAQAPAAATETAPPRRRGGI